MHNPTEARLVRQIDRHRRIIAEAEERLRMTAKWLTAARQTWRDLCHDRRVYDLSLFRKAAESLVMAKEGHDAALDIAERISDLST